MADVYEQDIARIHVGDEARVHVPSFAHQEPIGHITCIGNTIDPLTRVAQARIEIPNLDLSLRHGMFATVQVKGLSDGVVDIPIAAVLARRDQFFVFTKNPNDTFVQCEVRPGEQHGEHVQILSGIAPGDPVVTEGAILLDAEAKRVGGMRVHKRAPTSFTDVRTASPNAALEIGHEPRAATLATTPERERTPHISSARSRDTTDRSPKTPRTRDARTAATPPHETQLTRRHGRAHRNRARTSGRRDARNSMTDSAAACHC